MIDIVYHIKKEMEHGSGRWYTVAVAITPEAAGECVRVLLQCMDPENWHIKVEPTQVFRDGPA